MSQGGNESRFQHVPNPMGDPQREGETNPRLPILRFGKGHAPMIVQAFQGITYEPADTKKFGTTEGFPGKYIKNLTASFIGQAGNLQATIEISAGEFADLIRAASVGIQDTAVDVPRKKPLILNLGAMNIADLAPRKETPSNPLLAAIADTIEQELGQSELVMMQELAQLYPDQAGEYIKETALVQRAQLLNGLAELRRILGEQQPPKRLGLSERALNLVDQDRDLLDQLTALITVPDKIVDELPPEAQLLLDSDRAAFQDANLGLMFGWTTGSFTTDQARDEVARLQDEEQRLAALALQTTQPMQAIKPDGQEPQNRGGKNSSGQGNGGRR